MRRFETFPPTPPLRAGWRAAIGSVAAATFAANLMLAAPGSALAHASADRSSPAAPSSPIDADALEVARDRLAAIDATHIPRFSSTTDDGVEVTSYEIEGVGVLVLPDGPLEPYVVATGAVQRHAAVGVGTRGPYLDLNEADVDALLAGGSSALAAALCVGSGGTFCGVAGTIVAIAFSYANHTACDDMRIWLTMRNAAGGLGVPVCVTGIAR
ncbi:MULTISPECIES: hypothetical protein [unclassified Agrococcus]|uniref:hypothetical protein n=1 Tax=unclassified Agrococcus TaxID=2615065 RepID=UPI003616F6AA